jgi:hypothetical protein
MFILKSELQMFADASALAAATQLDGTQSGVTRANTIATAGPLGVTKPNGYNFDTTPVSGATATYATTFTGTYDDYATASTPATNTYKMIRVTASANSPFNFLAFMPGVGTQLSVTAQATAGQQAESTFSSGGLSPFGVDAHNQGDTKNFGLTVGTSYTLKWDNQNQSTCSGDSGFTPSGQPPSGHGYIDLGQGTGTSALTSAIEYGGFPNANSTPSSVEAGDDVYAAPGNRGVNPANTLGDRAGQDTDDTSTTYAQYLSSGTGNGRRIITVVVAGTWVQNGSNSYTPVIGFANFFLSTSYQGNGNGSICATYIGLGSPGGTGSGGSDGTKYYTNVLYQ